MSGNFRKNTSNFFVTLLIGLIVVSFMFTGYESMRGGPGSIASVGSYTIKDREYENEYRRQINFYKNALFQGKDLTAQDIERFGIKKAALQNLVQNKTRLIFADKADLHVAPSAIKKTVKEFEFFQSNGQFDINRYKLLLARNSLTPTDFEEDMRNDLIVRKTESLVQNVPISNAYINDIGKFKRMRYFANVVEINRAELKPKLPVSSSEVKTFLGEEASKVRVEGIFKQRKRSFDKPEKITARHILIKGEDQKALKKIEDIAKKTTPRNFKTMANKHTEDPSGKGKGGSLGEFQKGRMVPEFEKVAFSQKPGTISKPVKTPFGYHLIYVEKKTPGKEAQLKDYEQDIAKELIRNTKVKELDELFTSVKEQVVASFNKGDFKKVKKLQKTYGFSFEEGIEFNRFDGSKGAITLDKDQMTKVYESMKTSDETTLDLSKDNKAQLISYKKNMNKDLAPFDNKKEKSSLQSALSGKMRQDVIKKVGDTVKVKQYVKL